MYESLLREWELSAFLLELVGRCNLARRRADLRHEHLAFMRVFLTMALVLALVVVTPASFVGSHAQRGALLHESRHRSRPLCAVAELAAGMLVEFSSKDGSASLGAVTAADGKKNWKVMSASGATVSVPPRSIKHVFPGTVGKSGNELAAIARHEAAAEKASESFEVTALEEVWEMALEDDPGAAFSLAELSELLIGDAGSESYYATHRLLGAALGRSFFRGNKEGTEFVARPKAEAESLRAQADAAARAADAERELRERVQAAVDGAAGAPPFAVREEEDEVRAAFSALEAYACRANLEEGGEKWEARPTDDAAKALLQKLGRKATAETGRQVGLIEIGLRWLRMASDGFGWLRVASGGFGWLRMASDGISLRLDARWVAVGVEGGWLRVAWSNGAFVDH